MRDSPQEGELFQVYATLRERSRIVEQKRLEQEIKYFQTYMQPLQDFLHVYYTRFDGLRNNRRS